MKNQFKKYLGSLGTTEVMSERVEEILKIYKTLMPELLVREIFISESVSSENKKEYYSLFIFTDDYLFEAKNFISDTDLDITYMLESVDWLRMVFDSYDPGKPATSESRFKVRGYLVSEIDFEFRASAKNCEKLWQICRDIFMPNWVKKA